MDCPDANSIGGTVFQTDQDEDSELQAFSVDNYNVNLLTSPQSLVYVKHSCPISSS